MNYAKTPKDTLLNVLYILWTFSDIWLVLFIIWWVFSKLKQVREFSIKCSSSSEVALTSKSKNSGGRETHSFFFFFFFWGTLFNSNWEWVNRKKTSAFCKYKNCLCASKRLLNKISGQFFSESSKNWLIVKVRLGNAR